MRWRVWLIDHPARAIDGAWCAYWVFVAAVVLVCLTTLLLFLLAYLLGVPRLL